MNCANCGHLIAFDGPIPYPKPVVFCDHECLAQWEEDKQQII